MSDTVPVNEEPSRPETRKFKAEVKQVLDIVIHSLYTHREIFIRELVSNASDALEKMRHEALVQKSYTDKDVPHEIRILTDKEAHTLTVTDTGVGMTREELETNLGTIAQSGTREFIARARDEGSLGSELIGKFGVGFYSAFMAGEKVRVRTRSFRPSAKGYEWLSDGGGEYTIAEADNLPRGTSVTVMLREDSREYEKADEVKAIITKYSNFVTFPILVDGERVNTIQAIWTKSPLEVSDEEYRSFFSFLTNSDEAPLYRLHMSSDAPIQLSAILYVPAANLERFGFFRQKPNLNLYSRKILIVQNAEELLPEYLRFVAGVVDSDDLPLNISRETLQDNAVFRKLKKFLARRVLRFLSDEAKKDPKQYGVFWDTFGTFVKEGAVSDFENRDELAALLRFRSSAAKADEYISLDDYLGRMKESQSSIYYLSGRTREDIENGPYLSSIARRGIEVLFLLDPIDDFVMTSLGEFHGKRLVSADAADIGLPPEEAGAPEKTPAASEEMKGFLSWMKDTLGDAVSEVRESTRAIDRPAIIVNPDDGMTTSMRRILKATGREFVPEGAKVLEVNTSHPLIGTLKTLRDGPFDKGFLQLCVRQIFDNALAEAGLLENPRPMVERIYDIMERALKKE
jgi:TNF receptor-associated protein 1